MNPRLQKGLGVLLLLLFLFELAVYLIPLPWAALERPSSTLVFDREGKVLRAFTSADDMWRIRTDLEQVSPLLRKYLIFYEDRWFYYHPGVNPVSLVRALGQNLRSGRIISGGSTLSMQIARMIEPKARTWQNKAIELFRALQLEQRFTKDELLTIYFNIAPYGGNIEGVAAAAWLYFGKEPARLSPGEAALLTVLPNSPSQFRPDLAPDRARQARDKVLKRLFDHGLIEDVEYQEALAEEVPEARREWPFRAPHFSQELVARYPQEARIPTTINADLQIFLEDLLALEVAKLKAEGITNAAAVVIDNQTHQLVAAVGSAAFFNHQDQGQVNGYLAPRSPGSTLKPFVYALALEKGLLTPAHYVEDVPVLYSGYSPENYDSTYSGLVSAQEALQRSLNVPAVNLLAALGGEALYELLKKAGFTTLTPVNHYGLPMILGGCEVNLLELTNLYAALASGGKKYPVQTRQDRETSPPVPLFSPGVAYIITEILTEVRRPDLPTCWEFTTLPKVAWKTGTSYGHKDAWSIGYNPRYTVGVWVGNFSGEGRAGLNGAETAAPLLFTIFAQLNSDTTVSWFTPPATVKKRAVCAVSGQTPGPFCTPLRTDYYLADCSPEVECTLHQTYLLDPASGYRLPPHYYSAARATVEQVYLQYPPRVAAWLEANGQPVETLPPLLPEWQKILPGGAPVVRSPSADYIYQIRRGIPLEYQKICLEAAAGNDVQRLYWFIDGEFYGQTKPGERLFYIPEPGCHRVICQDDRGRSTEVKLEISD
jgi:penicillin-binding protein 1C